MICDRCGHVIRGVYVGDTVSGRTFCGDCILGKTKYDHKAVKEMYAKGMSFKTIAKRIGTNPLTVAKILRRYESDIKVR